MLTRRWVKLPIIHWPSAVAIAATALTMILPTQSSAADALPASVKVDFGARDGDLLRTERFNTWDNGDPEPQLRAGDVEFLNEQGLRADLVRVGFGVDSSLCDVQAQMCDFTPVEWIDDVSDLTESLVVHLTPSGVFGSGDPADTVPLLTLAIRELKERVPNVEYIEAFNEPEVFRYYIRKRFGLPPTLEREQLYQWYVPFYEAVNAVNAELHPKDRIKVGGPTLSSFDHEGWIPAFLDGYAADPNPKKRLDFVSWHGYGYFDENDGFIYKFYKDNVTLVADQRARFEAMLKERHITKQIPAFITETGIYPGPAFDEPDPSKNDWLRQAAGLASLHYWWADQPRTIPFHWTVRHESEGRKDQLVTLRHGSEPSPTDTFTPYGNMLLMQSKMKTTKVEAVSDTLVEGRGVYAIASKDKTGASLMVWNYQGPNDESFETTISMSRLPSWLRHGPVRQTLYRIDQNTSNYWADPQNANLQQVDQKIVRPGKRYVEKVDLDPNAIYLIIMEPLESGA
jgi:hypothetical protein